jgi:hypothetical protein
MPLQKWQSSIVLLLLLFMQSIERHQLDVPIASFAGAAQHLQVLQMDNVRLTAQVGGGSCVAAYAACMSCAPQCVLCSSLYTLSECKKRLAALQGRQSAVSRFLLLLLLLAGLGRPCWADPAAAADTVQPTAGHGPGETVNYAVISVVNLHCEVCFELYLWRVIQKRCAMLAAVLTFVILWNLIFKKGCSAAWGLPSTDCSNVRTQRSSVSCVLCYAS